MDPDVPDDTLVMYEVKREGEESLSTGTVLITANARWLICVVVVDSRCFIMSIAELVGISASSV
jgi:hypothetical protein